MRRLNQRAPRIAGLLALALGAVAFLALSGVAAAKDHGDDNGQGRHHHHHHRFLQEAGKISSFDATTGKLTIALPDGEAVTGMVTEETRIRCEDNDRRFDRRFDRRDHGGQGNEPGGDNGGHGNEPGDDNGGQSEPGDDRGGDNSGPGNSGSNGTSGGPGTSGESGSNGDGNQNEASCTVASLVPGAVVGEAELRLEGGGAVFTEVGLGQDS